MVSKSALSENLTEQGVIEALEFAHSSLLQISDSFSTGVEMLDYEWGNPPMTMISGEEPVSALDSHLAARQMLDHYATSQTSFIHQDNSLVSSQNALFPYHYSLQQVDQSHIHSLCDHRTDLTAFNFAHHSLLSLDPIAGARAGSSFLVIPKSEDVSRAPPMDYASRIGLNLGGRTYFSSEEDDFVSRLYRRSRQAEPGLANSPKCQAVGCTADLSHSKHYHRRHKVCEFHSKASTVIAAGLTQRFCQQCSRFHLLAEFDNGKRSCRKRLADHNRRRRKIHQSDKKCPTSHLEIPSSSTNLTRSPADSGAHSSSSMTVTVSQPAMSLDGFRQMSYPAMTSSTSSSSIFFPSG